MIESTTKYTLFFFRYFRFDEITQFISFNAPQQAFFVKIKPLPVLHTGTITSALPFKSVGMIMMDFTIQVTIDISAYKFRLSTFEIILATTVLDSVFEFLFSCGVLTLIVGNYFAVDFVRYKEFLLREISLFVEV